ncbi:MAG: pyridoxamine 5'-phosphate oxidase family protein [Candidatus Heimdallarchaeota archaeon]|nr:MAG: pyridoxamine 5'-phosphate oxidase family protein [Candidatus Heimdallarchaeota archaeon]
MKEQEMRDFCLKVINSMKTVCLTTIGSDEFPYTRAVFNLRDPKTFPELTRVFEDHNDDFLVYISTNTSSSKVTHIRSHSAVSLYYHDPEDFRGVMLSGNIEIVEDMAIKRELYLDWWKKYYPKGVEDEDYTILKLKPRFIEIYYKLQKHVLQLM